MVSEKVWERVTNFTTFSSGYCQPSPSFSVPVLVPLAQRNMGQPDRRRLHAATCRERQLAWCPLAAQLAERPGQGGVGVREHVLLWHTPLPTSHGTLFSPPFPGLDPHHYFPVDMENHPFVSLEHRLTWWELLPFFSLTIFFTLSFSSLPSSLFTSFLLTVSSLPRWCHLFPWLQLLFLYQELPKCLTRLSSEYWFACLRFLLAAAAAKSLQSCPTLCNPIGGSPPGSPVPGILQARTLEWVVISFSNAWKWKVKVKSLSRVRPSATQWTAAHRAPPSMGFSKQEYWSGVPLPSPWDCYLDVSNLIFRHHQFKWIIPPNELISSRLVLLQCSL